MRIEVAGPDGKKFYVSTAVIHFDNQQPLTAVSVFDNAGNGGKIEVSPGVIGICLVYAEPGGPLMAARATRAPRPKKG